MRVSLVRVLLYLLCTDVGYYTYLRTLHKWWIIALCGYNFLMYANTHQASWVNHLSSLSPTARLFNVMSMPSPRRKEHVAQNHSSPPLLPSFCLVRCLLIVVVVAAVVVVVCFLMTDKPPLSRGSRSSRAPPLSWGRTARGSTGPRCTSSARVRTWRSASCA